MESMHGALLDGESQAGEIFGRIDAEAKNVGCIQSPLFLFIPFNLFFVKVF